jgi:hypothetical protein
MKNFLTLLILLSVLSVKAQVNGYAKVTAVAGPALTISVSNETYDQFNNGDKVLVMQMQDDVIGSNTSNNSNFGNLSTIANAGKYELATIQTVYRTSGLPTLITLNAPLANTYNTGANSSVQVVTFPTLGGTGNYTTTSNITAVAWNGNYGGVVAFMVTGTLTLNHNITADNAGFRGGVADVSTNPYGSCNSTTYFNAVAPFFGNKGEGIYKATNANFAAGMGKIITGGGGGNTINSGGGGGGNYTAGGNGYFGWSCATGTGGIGGVTLGTHINGNRIFMGGGGGSGEANDGFDDRGGAGGGIIIIKATALRTTGTGAALRISANGEAAPTVGNDGAGGGGAGGSVVLNIPTFNIVSSKPVTIAANGGGGANVNNGAQHGAGGGGGQGAVIFTSPVPGSGSNVTITTNNGQGGLVSTSSTTRAASGIGSNGIGVMSSTVSVLPLKLLAFSAALNDAGVLLSWKTEDEENVSHFSLERSTNGSTFEAIATIKAIGHVNSVAKYSFNDTKIPASTTYYRLRMVDVDGKYVYSNALVVRPAHASGVSVSLYPNPVHSDATVFVQSDIAGIATIRVMNMQGATLMTQKNAVVRGENAISLNKQPALSAGVYSLQVSVNGNTYVTRMLVQ